MDFLRHAFVAQPLLSKVLLTPSPTATALVPTDAEMDAAYEAEWGAAMTASRSGARDARALWSASLVLDSERGTSMRFTASRGGRGGGRGAGVISVVPASRGGRFGAVPPATGRGGAARSSTSYAGEDDSHDDVEGPPISAPHVLSRRPRAPPPPHRTRSPMSIAADAARTSSARLSVNPPQPPPLATPVPIPRTFPRNTTMSRLTAVAVIPPKTVDQWGPFVRIKRLHMDPRVKRPPYPHVSLVQLFPSKLSGRAGNYDAILTRALSEIAPFSVTCQSFTLFENRSCQTLFLDPVESRDGSLGAVRRAIVGTLADTPEYSEINAQDFDKHIGVGLFRDVKEARALRDKYNATWSPLRFDVSHIYVIERSASDASAPWQIAAAIPLQGVTGASSIAVGDNTDSGFVA